MRYPSVALIWQVCAGGGLSLVPSTILAEYSDCISSHVGTDPALSDRSFIKAGKMGMGVGGCCRDAIELRHVKFVWQTVKCNHSKHFVDLLCPGHRSKHLSYISTFVIQIQELNKSR